MKTPYPLILKSTLLLTLSLFFLQGKSQVYISAAVNQPSELIASAGPDQDICPGDSTPVGGSPTANGGTSAYSYAWSPTSAISPTNTANPNAHPASTTTFVVTVTDGRNCTSFDTVVISVIICAGLEDPSGGVQLVLFPNPSFGDFELILDHVTGNPASSISVTDESGKLVYQENLGTLNGKFERKFSIPGLSAGIYLVQIQACDQTLTRKLSIQK